MIRKLGEGGGSVAELAKHNQAAYQNTTLPDQQSTRGFQTIVELSLYLTSSSLPWIAPTITPALKRVEAHLRPKHAEAMEKSEYRLCISEPHDVKPNEI